MGSWSPSVAKSSGMFPQAGMMSPWDMHGQLGLGSALTIRDLTPINQVPLSKKMLLEGKSASRGTTGQVASSLQHHSVRKAPLDHSCPNQTRIRPRRNEKAVTVSHDLCHQDSLASWQEVQTECPLVHLQDGCPRGHRNTA